MNRRELLRGVAAACLVSVAPAVRAEPLVIGRNVLGEFLHLICYQEWVEMSEDRKSQFELVFQCINPCIDAAYYRFRPVYFHPSAQKISVQAGL